MLWMLSAEHEGALMLSCGFSLTCRESNGGGTSVSPDTPALPVPGGVQQVDGQEEELTS